MLKPIEHIGRRSVEMGGVDFLFSNQEIKVYLLGHMSLISVYKQHLAQ